MGWLGVQAEVQHHPRAPVWLAKPAIGWTRLANSAPPGQINRLRATEIGIRDAGSNHASNRQPGRRIHGAKMGPNLRPSYSNAAN